MALRAERRNHVGAYDFVEDRTHDMLNVVDEFTHECFAIRIDRKLKPSGVFDMLLDLFILEDKLKTDACRVSPSVYQPALFRAARTCQILPVVADS